MNPKLSDGFQFDWTYPLAFVWGFAVLLSLVGWGRMLNLWLDPGREHEDFGWGMAAAWGMTAFLVLSGPMLMMSFFSTTFVAIFLLVGWGILIWYSKLARGKKEERHNPPVIGLKVFFIILCLFTLLSYGGAVAEHGYNDGDDFAAYFGFSKMALDMGTLADPFDYRLLGSVGGHPFLSTLVVAFFPWKYTHLLDMGIAGLVILGLTQGLLRGHDARTWLARLLLITFALTFSIARNNTASEFTGVVFFMALFCWLELIADRRYCAWKSAVLLGVLMAAASTLRCHNIFVIAMAGAGFVAWRLTEGEQNRRVIVRETLITAIAAVTILLPWWVVTYRSSGAFLFPLFKGTQRPDSEQFNYYLSHFETIQYVAVFLVSTGYLLFFWPVCLLPEGRKRRIVFFLAVPILLVSALFASQLAGAELYHLSRYLDPIGFAFALFTAGIVAQTYVEIAPSGVNRLPTWRGRLVTLTVIAVLIFQVPNYLGQSLFNVVRIIWAGDARHDMVANYFGPASTREERYEYEKAFAQIPSGAKTLIALDYPFLLNYREHSIYSLDIAGMASPDPGLPYFKGAEPVKKYLLSQGIHYLAHVPFDRSSYLHGRRNEKCRLVGSSPQYQFYAWRELDFYDNVDELAKSNRILYDSPSIRVIDLGSH